MTKLDSYERDVIQSNLKPVTRNDFRKIPPPLSIDIFVSPHFLKFYIGLTVMKGNLKVRCRHYKRA